MGNPHSKPTEQTTSAHVPPGMSSTINSAIHVKHHPVRLYLFQARWRGQMWSMGKYSEPTMLTKITHVAQVQGCAYIQTIILPFSGDQ
jgi:hypothetical protein